MQHTVPLVQNYKSATFIRITLIAMWRGGLQETVLRECLPDVSKFGGLLLYLNQELSEFQLRIEASLDTLTQSSPRLLHNTRVECTDRSSCGRTHRRSENCCTWKPTAHAQSVTLSINRLFHAAWVTFVIQVQICLKEQLVHCPSLSHGLFPLHIHPTVCCRFETFCRCLYMRGQDCETIDI